MTKAPRKQTDNHWERDKKNNDKAAKTASLRRFTARDNSGFHRSRSVKLFIDKQLIRNQGLSAVKTGFWTELNWNMEVGTKTRLGTSAAIFFQSYMRTSVKTTCFRGKFELAWGEDCSKNKKIRAKVDSGIYGRWRLLNLDNVSVTGRKIRFKKVLSSH